MTLISLKWNRGGKWLFGLPYGRTVGSELGIDMSVGPTGTHDILRCVEDRDSNSSLVHFNLLPHCLVQFSQSLIVQKQDLIHHVWPTEPNSNLLSATVVFDATAGRIYWFSALLYHPNYLSYLCRPFVITLHHIALSQ